MIRVVLARRLVLLASFNLTATVLAACTSGGLPPPEDTTVGGSSGARGGAAGIGGAGLASGAGGTIATGGVGGVAGAAAGASGAAGSAVVGGNAGAAQAGAGGNGTAGTAGAAGATGGASGASSGAAGTDPGGSAGAGAGNGGSAGTTAGSSGAGGVVVDPSTCTADTECSSGKCIEGNNGGKACAKTCKDGCDDPSFRCALVIEGTKPAINICVPRYWTSCRPCELDSQCRIPGDTTDSSRCVPGTNGVGSFCATDCQFTTCQAGFTCQDKGLPNGQSAKVCVPNGGDLCTCKPYWKDKGYKTTCTNTNGLGTCKGSRSCDSGTLTACDAPVPTAEICDGLDSDCDGSIDEGSDCSDNLGCTTDTCNPKAGGGAECGHAVQAGSCAINFQCVTANTLNATNPCQKCDPAVNPTGWTDLNSGTCDDQDSCTSNDQCVAGKCVGTAAASDTREPNNSFAAASVALPWDSCAAAFSKSVTGTIYPKGDEDWLAMSFIDTAGCNTKQDMTFRLTPPAGLAVGFDVYVACNNKDPGPVVSCNGANSNGGGGIPDAKGCGVQPATSVSTVTVTLGCGATASADDSAQVWVRAFSNSDKPICQSYTLNYGQVQLAQSALARGTKRACGDANHSGLSLVGGTGPVLAPARRLSTRQLRATICPARAKALDTPGFHARPRSSSSAGLRFGCSPGVGDHLASAGA